MRYELNEPGVARQRTVPRLWSVGKDAAWMLVMGLVCITTFAVSSLLFKFGLFSRA